MNYLKSLSVVFVHLLICLKALPQKSTEEPVIPAQVKTYLEQLITAFNTGDTLKIEHFIRTSHHSKVLEQVPMNQLVYRLSSVYYQYGPLEPKLYKGLSKTTAIVWGRGNISKAWVGIQFFFTEKDPHKITTIGIDRGQSPPENELFIKTSSLNDFRDKLGAHINSLKKTDFFSGSVAVSKNGKKIFGRTIGYADTKQRTLNNDKRPFLIASTSKIFTATAIMQLKEKGLLNTSDVIGKFIPEYPNNIADSVTVHQLLTHTSGIELDEVNEFNKEIETAESIKQMIDLQIKYIPKIPELLNFKLSIEFNYTNEGYTLLARIIEVVSGMDYWDYIENKILIPADLKNTQPLHKARNKVVKGYTNRNPVNGTYLSAKPQERVLTGMGIAKPAGEIVSTSNDLLLFATAISNGKLISKASFKEMTTGHVAEAGNLNYGYGIRVQNTIAGLCVGHAGDVLGFNCRLDIYPDKNIVVAVLANQDQTAKNMADYIREILPVRK